jgi:hypothetical protein
MVLSEMQIDAFEISISHFHFHGANYNSIRIVWLQRNQALRAKKGVGLLMTMAADRSKCVVTNNASGFSNLSTIEPTSSCTANSL